MEPQTSIQTDLEGLFDEVEPTPTNFTSARSFPTALERSRRLLALNTRQFADELRISEPLYRKWLAGALLPPVDARLKIVNALADLVKARLQPGHDARAAI